MDIYWRAGWMIWRAYNKTDYTEFEIKSECCLIFHRMLHQPNTRDDRLAATYEIINKFSTYYPNYSSVWDKLILDIESKDIKKEVKILKKKLTDKGKLEGNYLDLLRLTVATMAYIKLKDEVNLKMNKLIGLTTDANEKIFLTLKKASELYDYYYLKATKRDDNRLSISKSDSDLNQLLNIEESVIISHFVDECYKFLQINRDIGEFLDHYQKPLNNMVNTIYLRVSYLYELMTEELRANKYIAALVYKIALDLDRIDHEFILTNYSDYIVSFQMAILMRSIVILTDHHDSLNKSENKALVSQLLSLFNRAYNKLRMRSNSVICKESSSESDEVITVSTSTTSSPPLTPNQRLKQKRSFYLPLKSN